MSKAAHELYRALKKLTSTGASVFPGIVHAVNADGTVDVEVDEVIYPDVLIQASINDGQKGLKVKPAIDSLVMLERIGDSKSDEYMIILFSEVDEVSIEIGTAEFKVDSSGFLVKKGDDSLKDAMKLIIEAVQKIVVLQGTNPDQVKLQQALLKVNNILQ